MNCNYFITRGDLMRLATIDINSKEIASLIIDDKVITIEEINNIFQTEFKTDTFEILVNNQWDKLKTFYDEMLLNDSYKTKLSFIPINAVKFAPLYRKPSKIFGIGLNYADHAADLAEKAPNTEPASFFKPYTTIIGPNDFINIPLQSNKTTAEAELGIIFKKECKDIDENNWLDYIAGFTTIIDMTAEDILRKNPRYLTRCKSFDTFFSFGPELITSDEINDVLKLKVATVINNQIHAENTVSNMTFKPDYLVSFHSKVMTMLPCDIISTGTQRAVHINDGDIVECRIDGFTSLVNPVIDLKK